MVPVLYLWFTEHTVGASWIKRCGSVHWVPALTSWEMLLPANNAIYSCSCAWLQCAKVVIMKGTGSILLRQYNSVKFLKYFTHISILNARMQGDSWKWCILYTSWYVSCLYVLASYSNVCSLEGVTMYVRSECWLKQGQAGRRGG